MVFKLILPLCMTLLALDATFAASPAPYAGEQVRDIKALSLQEVDDYLAGKGMGLAKAAELNGYPGPIHVLELANQLSLSEAQIQRTQDIYIAMQSSAMLHGKALVERERELDRYFASGGVTAPRMQEALDKIAESHANIRAAHLKAHIEQRAILDPAQVEKYNVLRGYTSASAHTHQH